MADMKKQRYVGNLQTATTMVRDALEQLEQLRDEYNVFGYSDIDASDLENSSVADYAPAVFVNVWTTIDALQAIYNDSGHKANIFRVLP